MRFTIRHTFETDVDTFWEKIFFDEEFNRALFVDHLRFTSFKVLQFDRQDDGRVHRRLQCKPPTELPAVVKKVLGGATSYIEDGHFDPVSRKFTVDVIPAAAADKIKTRTELWLEARGDKRSERIATIDNTVKIFGVGKIIEKFIEDTTRKSYAEAADFTNRWIRDKGL